MKTNDALMRIAAPALLFALFFSGRWVNLRIMHLQPPGPSVAAGVTFGTTAALLIYFVLDLVLARGYLQSKILSIRIAAVYIVVAMAASCLSREDTAHGLPYATAAIAVLLAVVLISADALTKHPQDFLIDTDDGLPERYLRRHPVKTVLETIFRLFPYPVPLGLYKIGDAGPYSMVFVTGNYDLTVRRVAKALKGENCWLLVCNSRGINIWCSSLAGHFGTDDIVAAIGITGLAKKVEQRNLILPQLCASNVSVRDIKRKTGFSSCFGPIYIARINDYLKNPGSQELRLAAFNLEDRVEMAIGCPILLVIVLVCAYNFIGLGNLLAIIPTIYLFSVAGAVIYPNRFIDNIMAWSVATGAIVFAILYLFFSRLWHIFSLGNMLAISLGLAYLVTEFSGWSPLIKYGLIPHRKPRISVDLGLCTGCGTCLSVCPKGVYEMKENRAVVARPDECILCRACYRQCPVSAIIHSGNTETQVSEAS